MEKFKALGLSELLLKALKQKGYEAPREIQEKTIPLALAGKDVIGGSETGSGKTLAFGACIIEKANRGEGIQALILTPTRELAEQVSEEMEKFSKFKNLSVCAIYGGVAMSPQIDNLRRVEIVVGTPGRILDHLRQGTLKLSKIRFLVLDEADRMLDMGFIEDVETIIKQCPKERQTFLFSATISHDIEHIAKRHMKNPVYISAGEQVDPSKLKQIFYDVPSNQKFSLLVHLLKHEKAGLVMIFCNTRHNADFVAHNLRKNGIHAVAIHGGLAQNKRSRIMEEFKSSEVSALVCTDIAARGLDIPGISHVYNYDSPKNSKEYIHRIGRTARAGKEGIAISVVSNRDYENFRAVKEDDSLTITQQPLPENIDRAFMQINIRERGESFRGGKSFGGGPRFQSRFGGGRSRGGGGRHFGGRNESREGRSEGRSFGRSEGRSFRPRGRDSGRSFGGGRGRDIRGDSRGRNDSRSRERGHNFRRRY